jgi:hypothetical protein
VKKAAVGFRVHSGWCAAVAVYLDGAKPLVLYRERVELVEEFTYRLRQPYHTAEKMAIGAAREFIEKSRRAARDLGYRAICEQRSQLEQRGYALGTAVILLAAGKPLPELERILASHALIHTADGELFREALTRASVRCGLEVVSVKEKELIDEVAQSLRIREEAVLKRVTELGRPLGPRWSQDEKYAALGAWLALMVGDSRSAPGARSKPA